MVQNQNCVFKHFTASSLVDVDTAVQNAEQSAQTYIDTKPNLYLRDYHVSIAVMTDIAGSYFYYANVSFVEIRNVIINQQT